MHRQLLALLALLLVAWAPTVHATPPSMQTAVHIGEQTEAETYHVDQNAAKADDARKLQLDQLFGVGALLGDTNSTCPPECPLCQCNSTDDTECFLEKSVEACAAGALEGCYNGILASVSESFPGVIPEDFDVLGLCDVECDKPSEEVAPQFRELCRICDIFACCQECPAERAGECFPEDVAEGYTPPGWEPATCASGGVGLGDGWRLALWTAPLLLFAV
ncbi:hypothetical protein ACHAXT_005680 [Thalassiosira profunda]